MRAALATAALAMVLMSAAALVVACADAPGDDVMRGEVTRVVDGDTIHVRFDGGATEKVRLIGIDTPEDTTRQEPYGPEATAYARQVLDGAVVYLETDAELRDRYGRLLAYVWVEMPAKRDDAEIRSRMFNAMIVLDGYAQQATYPPNVRYEESFRVYAAEARKAARGLWAE